MRQPASPKTSAVSPPNTVQTRSPGRMHSTATRPRVVAIFVPAAKHGASGMVNSWAVNEPPVSAGSFDTNSRSPLLSTVVAALLWPVELISSGPSSALPF